MDDLWFGNVGIRVTDLARSRAFYTGVLGLQEIDGGGDDDGRYVLLKDPRSGQRLELNWYAADNPFAAPYTPGEALDHFEVRVRSVPEALARLKGLGIAPATRKVWVNRVGIEKARQDPTVAGMMDRDVWTSRTGRHTAFIQDPDGNFLCLYDHPEEPWDGPIPDHY